MSEQRVPQESQESIERERIQQSSIHDVARVAGVSAATVSRALRGLDRVKDETRARVLEAAAALNYVPSPTAASLASGTTRVVGVVVPTLSRWFFASLLDGVEQLLRRHGYHVLLFTVGTRGPTRRLILDQRLLWKRLDAVLVLGVDLEPTEVALLRDLRLPIVTVGVDLPGSYHVGIDDLAAAEAATTHLLELGHQRVAYVGDIRGDGGDTAMAVNRRTGVLRAFQRVGVPLDPTGMIVLTDWTVAAGMAVAERLLALDEPPTAVFAACDELAMGIMCAARRRGWDVPRDLSVIGVDDHELAFTHELTTIAQPVTEQGEAAGRLLLDSLSRPQPRSRKDVVLPTRLVVRASTTGPRIGNRPG